MLADLDQGAVAPWLPEATDALGHMDAPIGAADGLEREEVARSRPVCRESGCS